MIQNIEHYKFPKTIVHWVHSGLFFIFSMSCPFFCLISKITRMNFTICISCRMVDYTIRGECGRLICKMSWITSTRSSGSHFLVCASPPLPHIFWIDEVVPSLVLVQTKIKMCDYFLVSNKFPNPCSMLELLLRRWLSSSLSFSIRMDFIKNMLAKSWIDSVLIHNHFLKYLIYGWLIISLIRDCSFDSYILSQ